MFRKIVSFLMLFMLLLPLIPGAAAEETQPSETEAVEPAEIFTVEDLMSIADDPYGSYILMEDLDLSGVEWTALDFYGVFDGNGHTLLNLNLVSPGEEMRDVYDGNLRNYPCSYFGLFGTLDNARVMNLNLVNVRSLIEWDSPAFVGALAGYAKNTTISGCNISGTLELRAHDRCFGLAGMVGYGEGRIENCNVDVTLICVDTDPTKKDEQFLGGITAISFLHVFDCNVKLDAYVSEHGYVHSGGIMGMHTQFPWAEGKAGDIINTHISGKITFFENNRDRRAYCKALVGEPLPGAINKMGSTTDFLRDEVFTYDQELRPHMCENQIYEESVTAADCENYGYTTYTCTTCGYSYTDHYTLREHTVLQWTVTREPTTEEEGESMGLCACGKEHYRTEPRLEPEPTTQAPVTEPETQAATQAQDPQDAQATVFDGMFYLMTAIAALLLVAALTIIGILIRRR